MTNTFCPIPWIFQAARANGDLRVCCQANVTKNKGVIRKPDGTAYNAGTDNLDESRNAELMNAMRLNMMQGVWSEECGRCRQEEENGLVSRRSYENVQWKFNVEDAKQVTDSNGVIDTDKTPVRYYDLRFGNFCNLKCRMCGPTDSDSWYADWIKLNNTNVFHDTSGEVVIKKVGNKLVADDYNWPNNELFWQQLEKNIKNIEHVYFAGGEPMLIDRHYEFLEKCITEDYAKNIIVEYNTNLSTLPTRVLNLWKEFKQVRVGASIDGMEKVFEYQRHPAKWNKTLKNLYALDTSNTNIVGWLAFTVTAYNVYHMIDFMKWKLTNSNFKKINSSIHRPIITYHVAHHPKHLNIRVLPNEMKKHITDEFEKFYNWTIESQLERHVIEHAKKIKNGVITYMNSDSYYHDHWDSFKNYTKQLDKIRFEDLLEVEPLFKEYVK
jgi:MoaA/NifB/PqqE/SkfB family radical SAM enzyme